MEHGGRTNDARAKAGRLRRDGSRSGPMPVQSVSVSLVGFMLKTQKKRQQRR